MVASLVWVVAPFKVLQGAVIVLVITFSSVVEAVEMVILLSVLQEAVMVFVIGLFSVVVIVGTVMWVLSE